MSDEKPFKLLAEWFWTDRWMGSSAFLLPIGPRGLYREMLTQAWRRGARLPNDHEAIRRAVGCTPQEWNRYWPRIKAYWRVDGGELVNETQVAVYTDARAAQERASSRARKGAQARAQALAQAQRKQVLKDEPPSPSPSPIHSPERDPGSVARARLAFGGKVLEVPKFLDEEFVKRLNGQVFDLTAFYLALDQRLAQTGEPWDLRWIRDQFAAESPGPVRRAPAEDRPITADERQRAERHRRAVGGCKHDPRCETAAGCIALIIRGWRTHEASALQAS
jgi:uncharacterized protein YdaU (DUF1376 family)